MRPILIDTVGATQSPSPTGLEIVPWKPCFPAQLLQLWPVVGENPEGPLNKPGRILLKTYKKTKMKHLSLKRTHRARPTL
jgi:hypothetical protein